MVAFGYHGIEPIFGMNWVFYWGGTTTLKEPGMEFLIEELNVCNVVTNASCTLKGQKEQTVAPQQRLTLLK